MDGGMSYADVQAAVPESEVIVSDAPGPLDVDFARQHLDALDRLPRPTLVTCRTGPKSSAIAYLYAGLRAGASVDEVLAAADADAAPFTQMEPLRAFVAQGLTELATTERAHGRCSGASPENPGTHLSTRPSGRSPDVVRPACYDCEPTLLARGVHRVEHTSQADLEALRDRFLERTNKPRTRNRAKAASVAAASQHNLLYSPGTAARERGEVRAHWKLTLDELAAEYTRSVPLSRYERDVEALKAEMNREFASFFYAGEHPRYRYDPGFRVSHAQKSLSIYLKHLWCLGEVDRPPACPVDSIVLRRAGLVGQQTRWAFVNTIEQHRLQIGMLEDRATEAGLSLADWELGAWDA